MTTPPGRGSFAIIPTHNRHNLVAELAAEMSAAVDCVLVIDNASTPPLSDYALWEYQQRHSAIEAWRRAHRGKIVVHRDLEQPPNLSRLWQLGLRRAEQLAGLREWAEWDVAMLNDDAIMVPGWFDLVAKPMREHNCAVACAWPGPMRIDRSGTAVRWLYGPAFVMRGELAKGPGDPLWPDERLQWWGGDNLMDIRAQVNGGSLRVPGPMIENRHANESTVGALAEQAGRDRETFREIAGFYAW